MFIIDFHLWLPSVFLSLLSLSSFFSSHSSPLLRHFLSASFSLTLILSSSSFRHFLLLSPLSGYPFSSCRQPFSFQIFLSSSSFKNTKNLFIHIALIPEGDNPRVNPNILKCLLHSPVAKGYRLVVIASRAMVCKTPTYYLILNSLAFARGCVILRSHILFPLLLILLISHHI